MTDRYFLKITIQTYKYAFIVWQTSHVCRSVTVLLTLGAHALSCVCVCVRFLYSILFLTLLGVQREVSAATAREMQ